MKKYKTKVHQIKLVPVPGTGVPKQKMSGSVAATEYARMLIGDQIEIKEEMWMILLNNANNTKGHYLVGSGGITGTLVDIRICLKVAIGCLATSVIFTHNHPSGTLNPSNADIVLTKKMVEAFGLADIKVLDHVIVTTKGSYSFADENRL